jgi:hypothetical protein
MVAVGVLKNLECLQDARENRTRIRISQWEMRVKNS